MHYNALLEKNAIYCPSRQKIGKTRVHAWNKPHLSVYTRVEKSGRVNADSLVFLVEKTCKIIVSIILCCKNEHNTGFYGV
jgi:hypothetical protein